jgi:hypothetical protein
VKGITSLRAYPFLAIRKGEAIHLPDRRAVLDHFASAIKAYRAAAHAEKWTPVTIDTRQLGAHSVFATCAGMHSTQTGRSFETPGRATDSFPRQTGGGSSPTRTTSEPSKARYARRLVLFAAPLLTTAEPVDMGGTGLEPVTSCL